MHNDDTPQMNDDETTDRQILRINHAISMLNVLMRGAEHPLVIGGAAVAALHAVRDFLDASRPDTSRRDQLVRDLERIADEQVGYDTYSRSRDLERDHIRVDDLLMEYIADPEIESEFYRIKKLYS